MSLLALGTSVTWGQGLRSEEKFTHIVGKSLGLEVRSYAHSGATLWDPRESYPKDADEALRRLELREAGAEGAAVVNPAHGERPSRKPYLWKQLISASMLERPDVVLVDAGANDVDFISQIVTPDRRPSEVATAIEKLRLPTEWFLRSVLQKFPTAVVVVTSYYEAFTMTSDLSKSQLGWFLGDFLATVVPSTAVTNSLAFKVGFERIVGGAVDKIGESRLRFAPPDFGSDNGLFTGRSLLWEPGPLGAPQDHVIEERRALARGSVLDREICLRASFGHPNVQGARRYADAILGALQ